MPVCHYPNLTMLRALLLSLTLIAGLAQAATTRQQPVSLTTDQGTLHGSLLLPQSDRPLPVALLIAGSGPTDRNGNNPEGGHNDALKKLAQVLARNGIASLRYDKRGVGASLAAAPDERGLSVEGYVNDALAWSAKLKGDPRFSQLILIGHSEGALIASLAAPKSGAAALISIAGSGRPIDEVLREQLQGRLPPELLATSYFLIDELKAGRTYAEVPAPLQVLFRPSVQPYLISLFAYDPAEAFAAFMAAEGKEAEAVAAALEGWNLARKQLLDNPDPTAFAHEFYLLTRDTLLTALWSRVLRAASAHSDPQRLTRIATRQLQVIAAMRPARLALLGVAQTAGA